jgi:hypothetical protein
MKWRLIWVALFLTAVVSVCYGQSCEKIRARAVFYSGDSYLEIWRIGTHHTFFVVDEKSTDLILETMHYNVDGPLQGLYGDFTICPTKPPKEGHAQAAIVKRVENPRVVTLKK